ncbi:tyrosine-protein phosphatase [Desulfitobacterium metallireducens]|uniref:protein-tyrosine-phosphatase n=1 Tax=Desulfitobacterium metallireducens DSM 15288 TaxID=871968 RepID=W0EDU5_9FIRM|nr:CpsB/CapC family capsule biosynthesis tyrosine phosphatase [Desulfitobacterium metallireducens]AHF07668.1 histidinol phosphatase [Desulfitobacterium metallireducens DSM 15288]
MIDTHLHILPSLDDGVRDFEEAITLARQLVQVGYTQVIATPHVLGGKSFLSPEIIRKSVEQLNKILREQEIPLEVLPGAEIYLFPQLPRYVKEGRILTLGGQGKYLLVELPVLSLPHYVEKVFFELQVAGYHPVLAHPERYSYIMNDRALLEHWAGSGVLYQLNLRSLSGRYGSGPKEVALWLLKHHMISLVGTDTHHPSLENEPFLRELALLGDSLGEDGKDILMQRNPRAVLTQGAIQRTEFQGEFIRTKSRGKGNSGKKRWRLNFF